MQHRFWATCPITQCGFVRILSNPAFSRDALVPSAAVEYLATNVAHSRHRFLPDAVPFQKALAAMDIQLQGHQQTTDAYLVGLAVHHRARLATLDRSLATLVSSEGGHDRVVEIVSAE